MREDEVGRKKERKPTIITVFGRVSYSDCRGETIEPPHEKTNGNPHVCETNARISFAVTVITTIKNKELKCFGTLNESVLKIKDLSKPSILI